MDIKRIGAFSLLALAILGAVIGALRIDPAFANAAPFILYGVAAVVRAATGDPRPPHPFDYPANTEPARPDPESTTGDVNQPGHEPDDP